MKEYFLFKRTILFWTNIYHWPPSQLCFKMNFEIWIFENKSKHKWIRNIVPNDSRKVQKYGDSELKLRNEHNSKIKYNWNEKSKEKMTEMCWLTYGELPVHISGRSHSLLLVGRHTVPLLVYWQLWQQSPVSQLAPSTNWQLVALQHLLKEKFTSSNIHFPTVKLADW